MKNIFKWPAKLLLGLLTSVFPVFIAACYGCPDGECGEFESDATIEGNVFDKTTPSFPGIFGIEVSCLSDYNDSDSQADVDGGADGGAPGYVAAQTYTLEGDGSFVLSVNRNDCAWLQFKDVDGEENGGPYETVLLDSGDPTFYDDYLSVGMAPQE